MHQPILPSLTAFTAPTIASSLHRRSFHGRFGGVVFAAGLLFSFPHFFLVLAITALRILSRTPLYFRVILMVKIKIRCGREKVLVDH